MQNSEQKKREEETEQVIAEQKRKRGDVSKIPPLTGGRQATQEEADELVGFA